MIIDYQGEPEFRQGVLYHYHSMNNNRMCPTCRHPMLTHSCKHCGYKEKILKVVETQQDNPHFNFLNRIYKAVQSTPSLRQLSKQQQLTLYLREYQQLIKTAANRLMQEQEIDSEIAQLFIKEVRSLWQGYLRRKSEGGVPVDGMFGKYLGGDNNKKLSTVTANSGEKDMDTSKQEQEVRQQEMPRPRKRGRPSRDEMGQPTELSCLTQLRCYFNISVKTLVVESLESRKVDPNEITSAQKSMLSYLLGIKQTSLQLLKLSSYKYVKLLYAIRQTRIEKSYIRESQIDLELKRRGLNLMKKREHSLMLIVLVDLLRCWNLAYSQQHRTALRDLISQYEASNLKSVVIQAILEELRKEKKEEDPNIPHTSYQLIYSIAYLAAVRTGLTISVGEVITGCGRLQIQKIMVQEDLYLPKVCNEQSINSEKVRKTAHLLAHYLNLQFITQIGKWTLKWCKKLQLMSFISVIELINGTLYKEAREKINRSHTSNDERFVKAPAYFRFCELQQDIASMAGIVVFVKLAHGLTDYPYLFQSQLNQTKHKFSCQGPQFEQLKQLLNKGEITVTKGDEAVTKTIPQLYRQPFQILPFLRRLCHLNQNDKQVGMGMFNHGLIKLRNLANLNGLSSMRMVEEFRRMGQENRSNKSHEIKLRFGEIQHIQWLNEKNKKNKVNALKVINRGQKVNVQLSQNMVNQLGCIIQKQDTVIDQKAEHTIQCLLDQPCSNYQMMFEYSSDNLQLINRSQHLLILESLCLNFCTYSELTTWLYAYQSVLKHFQTVS